MELWDKLHEECGVFGIFSRGEVEDVVASTFYALYALQHRGQESCGIAVNDDGVLSVRKGVGLVNEVFTPPVLESMPRGRMAVGHCRYATTGSRSEQNAQPLILRHRKGNLAIAHNGNLTNADQLREEIELNGGIFHSTSDTESIAYTIIRERLSAPSIEDAVLGAMDKLQGAYSLVILSPRKLIAARDPLGFRPLCMGKIGESTVFASESCALDTIGAEFVRDIEPGEVVVVSDEGVRSIRTHCGGKSAFCVFEYIYFARPDSVINGSSVHTARMRAGALLALSHPVQADVVIGVPDSGLDAALGFARQSGIPYGIGFLKNKYIGRTFISPNQKQRESGVRIKLNPIAETVRGKRVVLVDDSIVRGTTCMKTIRLLREAGATEIHFRLSAPPFLYPCFFGTDIDSSENLIAYQHSVEEIRQMLGIESLGYLEVEDLPKLADHGRCGLCDACFTGRYPVEPPAQQSKSKFETRFSESSDD